MIKKRSLQNAKFRWMVMALVALLFLSIGIGLGTLSQNHTVTRSLEHEKLEEIRSYIDEYYLYDTDAESQLTGLYNGLIDSLNDPYAEYFTPDELEQFLATSEGELVGIGVVIQIDPKTQKLCITSVLPNGPAAKAGIRAGDHLLSVGDMPTENIPLDVLSQSHIMGEAGTQISLSVYRPSTNETLDVIITREKVNFPSTEYRMLENKSGYLSIFEFSDHLPSEFIFAIEALEDQGMEQLVLDLRNNPGGSLDAAVKVADYLLPDFFVSSQGDSKRATVVSLKDKHGNIEQYECNDGNSVDLPIVILVNEYTASASELLSGALRDYGRAELIGTNTFGKGISQTLIKLSDGSAVKLTNMEYFTPSGFALHGVGLIPDVIVENDSSLFDQDNQLQIALQTLEEIRQGKRIIPILVNEKSQPKAPKDFLTQAKQQPCKLKHFAFSLQEIETLLSRLSTDYGVDTLYRTDSWAFNEESGYERMITLNLSLDEDMSISFSIDSITEELHRIELYLPTQKAVDCCLDILEAIDPSFRDIDQDKLKKKISSYPIEEDRTLKEIIKNKDYSIYAGYEEKSLSIIIE